MYQLIKQNQLYKNIHFVPYSLLLSFVGNMVVIPQTEVVSGLDLSILHHTDFERAK